MIHGKLAQDLVQTLKLLGGVENIAKHSVAASSLIDNDLMNDKLFLQQYNGAQLIDDHVFMKAITKNCKNANSLFEPLYNDKVMVKVLQQQKVASLNDHSNLKKQIIRATNFKPRDLNSRVLLSRIENRLMQIDDFYTSFVQKNLPVEPNYNLLNELRFSSNDDFSLKYHKSLVDQFNQKSSITIFFKLKNPNISNIEIKNFSMDLDYLNNQLRIEDAGFQRSKLRISKIINNDTQTANKDIEKNLLRYNLQKRQNFFKLNKLDEYTLLHALKLYELEDVSNIDIKTFKDLQHAIQCQSLDPNKENNFIFDYFFKEFKDKFAKCITEMTDTYRSKTHTLSLSKQQEISILRSIMKNYYSISINFPLNNSGSQLSKFYQLLDDNQDVLELIFTQINYKKIPKFLNVNLLELIKSKKETGKLKSLAHQISQDNNESQFNNDDKNFFEYLATHDITLIKKQNNKNCIYFYKKQNI